ncbi:hypothetical protein C5C27_08670 [Rathayibacter sp. AY2B7]|uniref:hypothetical protein n=1 Tax=Rathayibacter sp. AY2B7 TaxID=2080571 RepID=UPI000CE8A82B|nr:hypothetical protein [Rathayibacter sp. AY2B7]PPG60832.1 hypothetical protein C5C27_08670 [Rathayibacter sp. AY2B7]
MILMGARELAWGILAWPIVAVLALLRTAGSWDVSGGSAAGIVAGTAAAFAVAGALLWLPSSLWLDRRTRRFPRIGQVAAFLGLGLVIGAAASTALVLASGNATWPSSAGLITEYAVTAGIASLLGRLLAATLRAKRLPILPTAANRVTR